MSKLTDDLQALPFGEMIGGPLSACIDAQEQAALTTVNFIRNVGFAKKQVTENGKTKEVYTDDVINVTFKYKREKNEVELTVPLLTIVPIPFIAIDTVSINFKATLKSFDKSYDKDTESESSYNRESSASSSKSGGWFSAKKRSSSSMYCSVSTKKDSVSTQTSEYSVESTIDVQVNARQESMPAGMAKVLEMLNQAIFITPEKDDEKIARLEAELKELKEAQKTV